jgi:acyl-CoA dehydrogenase
MNVIPFEGMSADTLEQLRETIRRFVRERLVPLEGSVARDEKIPCSIVQEMRDLGLFGISIPEEYGGLGLTMSAEVQIVFEMGWTSPVFRSVFGTNVGIGSQGILMDGTETQRKAYLPRLASGELIGAFALTEPEAGSDARAISTFAKRDGDTYVINGTKRYITNAPTADLFTLIAKTGEEDAKPVISAFLVEAKTPGLHCGKPERKMGQQGADICDVIFENCRVSQNSLLGGVEGQGFDTVTKVLTRGRLHIAALCVGIAERLIHESVTYAVNRRQFGQRIGDFQLVQAMLADSRTEANAGRSMILDAARRYDAKVATIVDGSTCKLFASEMVGRVADRAVQIFGGAGYIAEYGIERFYRDVRLFRLYEGTSEIQRLIIGRQMMRDAS